MQRSWNSSSVCVMKTVSSPKSSCPPSSCSAVAFLQEMWNAFHLVSWGGGLCHARWKIVMRKQRKLCATVPLPISVQLHCMLFHKPSCKDQTRFKHTLGTINLLFQWLKKAISTDQPEKKSVIYENHEKSFLSTHTFFLQSPNNNASIHLYAIY